MSLTGRRSPVSWKDHCASDSGCKMDLFEFCWTVSYFSEEVNSHQDLKGEVHVHGVRPALCPWLDPNLSVVGLPLEGGVRNQGHRFVPTRCVSCTWLTHFWSGSSSTKKDLNNLHSEHLFWVHRVSYFLFLQKNVLVSFSMDRISHLYFLTHRNCPKRLSVYA